MWEGIISVRIIVLGRVCVLKESDLLTDLLVSTVGSESNHHYSHEMISLILEYLFPVQNLFLL